MLTTNDRHSLVPGHSETGRSVLCLSGVIVRVEVTLTGAGSEQVFGQGGDGLTKPQVVALGVSTET